MNQHVVKCQVLGGELRVYASAAVTDDKKSRGVIAHISHGCGSMGFWLNAADARAIAHALTLAADEALLPLEEVTE